LDLSYVEDMAFMLRCIGFPLRFLCWKLFSYMTILVIDCRSDDYF